MSKKHKKQRTLTEKNLQLWFPIEKNKITHWKVDRYLDDIIILRAFDEVADRVKWWNENAGHYKNIHLCDRAKKWDRSKKYRKRHIAIFEEEANELIQAARDNNTQEMLDGFGDVIFTLFGMAAAAGMEDQIGLAILEVIVSNDSKLKGDKPHNAEGKLLKTETFVPPRFDLVAKAMLKEN